MLSAKSQVTPRRGWIMSPKSTLYIGYLLPGAVSKPERLALLTLRPWPNSSSCENSTPTLKVQSLQTIESLISKFWVST